MAQSDVKKLDSRDSFPAMKLNLADGASLALPDKASAKWCVLLVYRGIW